MSRGIPVHTNDLPALVHWGTHSSEGWVSPHEDGGYYVHGETFGMRVFAEQRVDHERFDPTYPITWEYA